MTRSRPPATPPPMPPPSADPTCTTTTRRSATGLPSTLANACPHLLLSLPGLGADVTFPAHLPEVPVNLGICSYS